MHCPSITELDQEHNRSITFEELPNLKDLSLTVRLCLINLNIYLSPATYPKIRPLLLLKKSFSLSIHLNVRRRTTIKSLQRVAEAKCQGNVLTIDYIDQTQDKSAIEATLKGILLLSTTSDRTNTLNEIFWIGHANDWKARLNNFRSGVARLKWEDVDKAVSCIDEARRDIFREDWAKRVPRLRVE